MIKKLLIATLATSSFFLVSCSKTESIKQASKETQLSKKEDPERFADILSYTIKRWSMCDPIRHYPANTEDELCRYYSEEIMMIMRGMDGYGTRNGRNYFGESEDKIIKMAMAWPADKDSGHRWISFGEEENLLFKKGIKYCEQKSKEENDTYHNRYLASFYLHTNSSLKDIKKFLFWSYKDAESGNEHGMLYLAYAFASGTGVFPDLEESIKWIYLAQITKDNYRTGYAAQIFKEMEEMYPETMAELKPKSLEKAKVWMGEHPDAFFNLATAHCPT